MSKELERGTNNAEDEEVPMNDYTLYVDDSPASQEAVGVLESHNIQCNVVRPDRSGPPAIVPYLRTAIGDGFVGIEAVKVFVSREKDIREYTNRLRERIRQEDNNSGR